MSDFNKIYNKCLSQECPPTEGNKEKALGCYNGINDFGKEPTEDNCRECWKNAFKEIVKEL